MIRNYGNIKKIQKDHLKPKSCNTMKGLWIYGKTGVGKSKWATETYPDAYFKPLNKWWDGYDN